MPGRLYPGTNQTCSAGWRSFDYGRSLSFNMLWWQWGMDQLHIISNCTYVDPELCPSCGERMRVVAAISSPFQDSENPAWFKTRLHRGACAVYKLRGSNKLRERAQAYDGQPRVTRAERALFCLTASGRSGGRPAPEPPPRRPPAPPTRATPQRPVLETFIHWPIALAAACASRWRAQRKRRRRDGGAEQKTALGSAPGLSGKTW
jgi:hypothetical protein